MNIFADYATDTAFSIALSKAQIECLCRVDQSGSSWSLLTTSHALQRKGLIERSFTEGRWTLQITDAGRALMPLLKLAGVWVDCEIPKPYPIPAVKVQIKVDA